MAQQERAIRTRQAILEAAATVFDERGYEAATIGEILTKAGVTKGALYFHFPSKKALAEGVIAEQFSVLYLGDQPCKLQQLVDLGLLTAYHMRRDSLVSASARLSLEGEMGEYIGPRLTGEWISAGERILVEAKEQGELLPYVDPSDAAWIFSAAWTGVQIYSATLNKRVDLEDRVTALFQYLLPSIAVPAVLSRLEMSADRAAELGAESRRLAREAAATEDVAEPAVG